MANDEQHNDPIEELFRVKAEEYDISFNEADWNRLEQRLDNWESQRSRVNRWRWVAAAALLIIGLLSYFTYENYQAIDRLNQQLTEERTQNQARQDDGDNSSNVPDTEQEDTPVIAGADSTDKIQPAEPRKDQLAERSVDVTQDADETGPNTEEISTTNTTFTVSEQAARNLYINNYYCPGCRFAGITAREQINEDIVSTKISPPTPASNEPIAANWEHPDEPGRAEQPPIEMTAAKSRVSVGLVAGPDLSTVGSLSNTSQPGYQVGISAEYQLSDRLAISAGIARSRVYYSVRNFRYSTGSPYSSGSTVVPQTEADCAILDIPVTLKYNFLEMNHSRLFASAGFSSYIMLNENYQFSYNGSANGRPQRWSSRTGTKHWMSNLNFSLGYELDVMNNWSIRAAPFIKLPVRKVGWGQVELFSMGTSVSLNYRL